MEIRKIPFALVLLAMSLSACNQEPSAQEYFARGQEFAANKEWSSAIIEFKNTVRLSPDNAQARAALGKVYVESNFATPAVKELTKAISLGHNRIELLIPLAKAYRLSDQPQKIIDEIKIIDGLDNNDKAEIYAFRANAFLSQGNEQDAVSALEKARTLNKNSAEVRLAWAVYEGFRNNESAQRQWLQPLLGGVHEHAEAWSLLGAIEQKANNLQSAERAFTRSIELRPYGHFDSARRALARFNLNNISGAKDDIDALRNQGAKWPVIDHIDGLIAYKENRFDEAQSLFLKVLSSTPEYAPSQLMLGIINFQKNNLSNAASYLEQYLMLNPDEYRPNLVYALILLKQGNSAQASKILSKLHAQNPNDTDVLSLLASAYLANKDSVKAITHLRKAVALKPQKAGLRLQLGTVLLNEPASVKQGQQQIEKALELDPNLIKAEKTLFMSYLNQKRYPEARSVAQAMDKRYQQQSEGANLMALSYLAEGKTDQARKTLEKTLQRFSADITASELLARIYLDESNIAQAKALYEKVLKSKPSNLMAMNRLAQIAAREGDKEQLLAWLKKAQQSNPAQLAPKLALANFYLSRNDFKPAVELLNGLGEDEKKLPGYMILMAQAKMGIAEHQHAIRLLKALLAKQPQASSVHFLLAQAYAKQNKPALMRASLENAIKINSEYVSAHIMLARLDLLEGKSETFKKRVAFLEQNYPDNQDVQLLKAKTLSSDQNYKGAIDKLASLMEQAPRSEVVLELSRNQWSSGDKEVAIQGLEFWAQGNPDDSTVLMLLAEFYLANNQPLKAKETYTKLDKQLPNNPVVLNNLAWLMKDSNPDQAISYASKALDLKPDSPFIEDTLAMLYLKTGDPANALVLSGKAAEQMPDFFDIQYNYATILAANNSRAEAKRVLKKLIAKAVTKEQTRKVNELMRTL